MNNLATYWLHKRKNNFTIRCDEDSVLPAIHARDPDEKQASRSRSEEHGNDEE